MLWDVVWGLWFNGKSRVRVIHTWLERAEITQPWTGLQSRSKSRLQLSGGLSFASVIPSGQPRAFSQELGGIQIC